MDHQPSGAAPGAGGILRFVALVAWRSKWLIGAATLIAVVLTFAIYRPGAIQAQAWTGKTTVTIGLVPPVDYILQLSGSALAPIESPRNLATRISDPVFRTKVLDQAAFEPATAAFSRSMVSSSLRGIAGESDRDVAVELTAGSAADVQAAFSALAAVIGQAHGKIIQQRLKPLQDRINDAKNRLAAMDKSAASLNDRIFAVSPDGKTTQMLSPAFAPTLVVTLGAWNELQDRIQRDTNLTQFVEPSILHLEANTYPLMPRSVGSLKASILAGLAMLVAMIVLTIVVGSPVRRSRD